MAEKLLKKWFDWCFSRNPDADKCCVCSKKGVTITIKSEEKRFTRGFCGSQCYDISRKQYEEYLKNKKCKYPGCDKKCYVENNGEIHDFCDRTHAIEFKKLQVCKLPGCVKQRFTENGKVHDFCCKSHADQYQPKSCGFHVFPPRQPTQSHGYFTHHSTGPIFFYSKDEPYYEFTNFAMYPVRIDDKLWPTTEHYFQAQKFIGTPYVERIRSLSAPRWAFDFSRKPEVSHWRRSDWEQAKEKVMEKALWAKFTQHSVLHKMLLDTGGRRLVEHTSNDRYWGDGGDGSGKNRLGNLLMDVRQKLRQGNMPLPHQPRAHIIKFHGSKPVDREQLQAAPSSQEPPPYKDGRSSPHTLSEDIDLMRFDNKPCNGSPVFGDPEMDSILCCYMEDSPPDAENSVEILQPQTMDYTASVPPQNTPNQLPNTIIIGDHSPTSSSVEELTEPVTSTTPVSIDTTQPSNETEEEEDMDIDK